ncbi:hypothetical protein [Sulfolobus acidocaldarius]|uniref:Uncharacterized protein n=3 Tax=Sulfolobus acidocaldarius TaxID=2285 RepID=A0A0U3GYC3_9CREN|nr:hypothetical protein [Sulfolobus acidocaldarius]AGE71708.1 hypothetical protein SacN8_08740 [Sulfolobus acidocaldarius N8]AGE73981.1 hypothetical protein SacRon12I_08750 [Sulfolobus acidocaldarius Ron12/I]ALU30086.1 hypothetical protein ATY89_09155 [Sulfolobus acidocaldarius]ALU30776.1 hypothetical protein ATZ20_00565 [Sulfolobus acidocaldarius]WCM35605.1 hypothetical protein GO597_09805 [Sulfolobus acidocaldarius DSM 639]
MIKIVLVTTVILLIISLTYLSSFVPAFDISNSDNINIISNLVYTSVVKVNNMSFVEVMINTSYLQLINEIEIIIPGNVYHLSTIGKSFSNGSSINIIITPPIYSSNLVEFYTNSNRVVNIQVIIYYSQGDVGILSL